MRLFKNKKMTAIISGCLAVLLMVAIILAVNLHDKKLPVNTAETVSGSTSSNVVIEEPDTTSGAANSTAIGIKDDGSGLTPPDGETGSSNSTTGKKAQSNATTAKVQDSSTPAKDNSGGIQIGGGETTSKYKCGCANHHCDSPETHAFVLNLELEGCPYCGSHSCPSFYGVDEWGNAGYFPKLCPKYDIKKDPVYYCQECGKKTGDGSKGTCVRFVKDCNCPNCGVFVKAGTCHTCK
ncbi:MAG: hypothetical protein BGN88_00910 [Clostridiales bacterium 43-6]|nr:MAG: hypothetical protein BGN88_00910 [Clostridiales bacterium 43-6]